jgi:hypothetical protein
VQPVAIDQWSPLSHKAPLDPETATTSLAKSWTPDPSDERRLAAYYVLDAYRRNVARSVLRDSSRASDHREYGDAGRLVERLVAAVLGADWGFEIHGAEDDLTAGPSLGERPTNPPEGTDELVKRLVLARQRAWDQRAEELLGEYEEAVRSQPALRARNEALSAWFSRRHVASVVTEAEDDAVALGDAVIVLWPQENDWPRISVLAPDSYFPLRLDSDAGEFPDRIDIAWEFVETDQHGASETYLRRHTWEIVEIAATRIHESGAGWRGEDGEVAERPLLYAGDGSVVRERLTRSGQITRLEPWHQAGDEATTRTCVYTEAVWPVRNLDGERLRELDLDRASSVPHFRSDLLVDFIPVIHVPNSPSTSTGWGVSSLSGVAQALDDVATNDTDAMQASRYLSDPTIFVTGVAGEIGPTVAPGRIYKGGENGSMTPLDLAVGLEKLMVAGDRLQDRYWQNAGVPAEVVGRAEATNESGIALALRLAPFAQVIGMMRMARESKYGLVVKFAQRLAQIAGVLDPGPTPSGGIRWGNFLPTNRAETVEIVSLALAAHAISTQTAVAMLVAAGIPVDDAAEEIERIRAEDGGTAKDIADATGSEELAAGWLGLELPGNGGAGAPPVVDLQ